MALEQEDSMSVPERNEGVADLIKRMELGLVNDEEIRRLMRIQIENRLKWGYKPTHDQQLAQHLHFINSLKEMKMATEMDSLDSQVYESPNSFQQIMCGRSMKESAGLFMDDVTTVEEAHIRMMDLYCDKATFEDGQKILDLGCGHGSVVLHVAQKYKGCQVTGVITNSSAQKQYIVEQCKKLDLSNVEIILADVTTLEMEEKFDRVIIIGLIEHMKNFKLFFQKVSKWMKEGGLLFLENYFHKDFAYHCEKIDEDDWYDGYIFPPGSLLMPSASTLLYFQEDLTVADHWVLPGTHFAKTFEEFLKKIDLRIEEVREIFEAFYGISKEEAMKLSNYWRIFCISAMEIFNYNNGQEWMISHLLYTKK